MSAAGVGLHKSVFLVRPVELGFAEASRTGLRQEVLQKIVPPADF
jgi:hypothetical protein